MVEIRDGLGLGDIQLGVFRSSKHVCVRHLDRDVTTELLVVSQVNDSEAAFAKHSLDPIATNSLGHLAGVGIIEWHRLNNCEWAGHVAGFVVRQAGLVALRIKLTKILLGNVDPIRTEHRIVIGNNGVTRTIPLFDVNRQQSRE